MPYIPGRRFSVNYSVDDIDCSDYEGVIDKFKDRIKGWYIEHAKIFTDPHHQKFTNHGGFPAVAIACILIDLLSMYEAGSSGSSFQLFTKYLKNKIPEFRQSLTKSYPGFRKRNINNIADAFYEWFRCGIMHNAKINTHGSISATSVLISWDNSSEVLTVDPHLLIPKIEEIFDGYIQELKDGTNQRLVDNFKTKFLLDFRDSINPTKSQF